MRVVSFKGRALWLEGANRIVLAKRSKMGHLKVFRFVV
jgi:hypothetical protein